MGHPDSGYSKPPNTAVPTFTQSDERLEIRLAWATLPKSLSRLFDMVSSCMGNSAAVAGNHTDQVEHAVPGLNLLRYLGTVIAHL